MSLQLLMISTSASFKGFIRETFKTEHSESEKVV